MNVYFCDAVGEAVNYSISSIDAGTLTDSDAKIPGMLRCSNTLCNLQECPLEETYSKWMKSKK